MSAELAASGLPKVTVFWNKFYGVLISIDDVTNKILSQPQFYKDLTRKAAFFEEWSWFKFNNLGLALGTNLKFYTSVPRVKTGEKVLEANSYVFRTYRRKASGLPFLNRVKVTKAYWTSTGKAEEII